MHYAETNDFVYCSNRYLITYAAAVHGLSCKPVDVVGHTGTTPYRTLPMFDMKSHLKACVLLLFRIGNNRNFRRYGAYRFDLDYARILCRYQIPNNRSRWLIIPRATSIQTFRTKKYWKNLIIKYYSFQCFDDHKKYV